MSKNSQISELINYLSYDSSGNIILSSLVGTGTRMVVSSSTGLLSTQAIPTLSDLSGVPTSRTLTINGVTYDLTANRSWSALPTGGVAGDILAKVDGTDYNATWIPNYTSQVQHLVKLGATMTAGTAVYVSSSTGNSGTNMIVSKASNATEGTSSKTLGLIKTGGNTNDIVFVITEGLLAGLDTSTASAGDPVWLGTNGGLIFGLLNKPVAPAHLVFIGVVTRAQQINGEIFVKVQNGFELGELHDYVQNGVQDNYVISYESSSSLYKPKSIATLLGYTPQAALSGTGFVKISGSTISYDNSTYLTTSSASSTYLPLTGGTLTGALNGTSGTFSGAVSGASGVFSGSVRAINLYNLYKSDNTTLGGQLAYDSSINQLYLWNNISSGYFSIYVNSTEAFKISSNSAATFNSTIQVSSKIFIQRASNGADTLIQFKNEVGVDRAYIKFGGTNEELSFYSGSGGTENLKISSTGAATFSSSVTATYGYFSGTGSGSFNSQVTLNNTTSSPALITFQNTANGHAFGFTSTGTQRFTFINGGLNEILSVTSAGVVTAEQQFRTKIGYQFYADSTAQGGIYPYKIWSGTGTDTTPTFAAEGNLGVYFCVNGTVDKVLRLASTGHLLVGSTSTDQSFWPSWDGGVIRIGQGGTIFHYRDSATDFMIGGNYYISSSGAQETRIATGGASNIYLENGNIRFRNAISGAAGSSISWNTSLFLQTNGFVGVSTQTQWNYEKFGVGMSQSNTWENVTAIMRLTNYISGGVTKITFTDSSIIDGWFGMVPVSNGSYFVMGFSGQTEQGFKLYQNGTSYFANTVTVNGSILPNSDAAYNLGSTSYRWANVYTTDLHLSNKGNQNDVDGTWGDWTLQEGENDIFMLNNRSGEKFKMKLEKV